MHTRPVSIRSVSMKSSPARAVSPILAGALLASLSALSPSIQAQSATVTYDLNDVWLLPDISHPRASARQMTGTFEWTYTVGDFENGSGRFLAYQIPWWNRTSPSLTANVAPDSIEFTLNGNYHDLGVDLTLRMAPPLSPYLPSPIDTARSGFEIQVGVSHQGHVVSGSVVPRCQPPENYGSGTAGSGGFVPTITSSGGDPQRGSASFRIDCDRLLGGASCFLILGAGRDQLLVAGVTILVRPDWIVVASRATGTAGVPGVGALRVPIPIPDNPGLVGAEFDFQALALDSGSPTGIAAATDGLAIVICN
jgi:hypothetical protein